MLYGFVHAPAHECLPICQLNLLNKIRKNMLSPPAHRYDQWKFSTQMFNHNLQLFAMVIDLRAYSCYIRLLKTHFSAFALALRSYLRCDCAVAIALRRCTSLRETSCLRKTSATATMLAIAVAAAFYKFWPC